MANPLLDTDLEIDRIVGQFEQGLRRGEELRIEDQVGLYPRLGQKLIHELLATEIEFRKLREIAVDWDDYARRFPQAAAELLAEEAQRTRGLEETSQDVIQHPALIGESSRSPGEVDEAHETPLDLSDYELESWLGGGGQGDVHLAIQRSLGRRVAVKLLTKASGQDRQSERRFLREARTLAQTSHPQIVTIHGVGRSPRGELFLVMEYIPGKDLAKQIAEKRFLVHEAVEITIQIACAVEHAHARGVIHRDLKPSNVLWHDVRGPVVTDFGLAKDLRATDALTLPEQLMGTPVYMAPEQAHQRFGEISERTDVYGLAATLYALLTGRPPVAAGPLVEILRQVTSDDPVTDPRHWRTELPASLSAICLKGLAKYPEQRFATIHDFSLNLRQWLAGKENETASHSPTALPPTQANPSPPPLEPGQPFGRYQLKELLSRDPTRKVFRAEDEGGRQVLLKCLPPKSVSDPVKRSQFRQEVLLATQVSHPCLAKVIEAGTLHNAEFLALEFLEGESLEDVMARRGRFSQKQAAEILLPIAEVLHLMHGAGILYRDLRPKHILLDRESGQPRLAEVRLSQADLAQCTLASNQLGLDVAALPYQAPEFWMSQPDTPASDVYMLGATLFAMVTGQAPFASDQDHIKLLVAKNAGATAPLKSLAPDASPALCELIQASLQPNPARRPASAEEFARRLSACVDRQPTVSKAEMPADPENLLHAVWEQLDADLQDAFSLAYNKKRRTGSTRISTSDLFAAMARLGTGPLRDILSQLPAGALPEPVNAEIPLDRAVLAEQPLLSDCVRESLTTFRKLGPAGGKIAPVDLFVDVAKHGHGSSVVRLREHGVDPAAMERIVEQLGLRVVRRESIPDVGRSASDSSSDDLGPYLSDDNVQFSVYRPKAVPPETWQPLLAFAHLAELPPDAPAGSPDPIAEVQRQAEQILGSRLPAYQSLTADSNHSIPRSSELTFVPTADGLTFNPPQRSFLWQEPVHREEFRFKAAARLDGQLARGRLSVYLGRLLIAEVSIVTRIDRNLSAQRNLELSGENRAFRFRRIFACVSPKDQAIVAELRRYAQLLRDTFLTSQFEANRHDVQQLIRSADVFQLYWSTSALESEQMQREWKYALSLRRTDFIRSLYWEEPFPTDPARSLPPPELLAIGFQKAPVASLPQRSTARSLDKPISRSISHKLQRVRQPQVQCYLELLNGPDVGRILRLEKDRVTIGRNTDADLPLESGAADGCGIAVSQFHAQVICDQNTWFVEDLHTRNGTFVNGHRARERVQLRDGDKIHVGDFLIRFRASIAEAVPPPPVASAAAPSTEPETALLASAEEKIGPAEVEVEDHGDGTYTLTVNGPAPYKPGDVIGRYRLIKIIAWGGFGKAYLARLADEWRPRAMSTRRTLSASDDEQPACLDLGSTSREMKEVPLHTPTHALGPSSPRPATPSTSVFRWWWVGLVALAAILAALFSGWRPW